MPVPSSHVDEGLKLTADGEVVFFEIALKNVPNGATAVIRFRDGPQGQTTTWNGKVWDHLPCQMSGFTRSSEEERNRPTLQLVNPLGIFNDAAFAGRFDSAILQKFTVLRDHVERGLPIANNEIWFIGRVMDLISGQSISFELRALSDVPDQLIPARMFTPGDGFPFVTL
ncbi:MULTISPECIES: hypothetical protein [Methylobacterium]|jgi:phage-related protein|uniref:Uncharacterized protein n=3 Tax=Pseudomonadota TaxID=1224 RepID=A0ABQ4T267_9HYPH|nr:MULTISPECIES: hypothetical protein [Methylobacterium]PIU05295.1 MAG: hypothetical protein COT56_16030 [Methylobacterium sp. CG09_land_8_20_14_0_10_71_15]PIU12357.1 MAG: hypothetical protein COT28_15310 [Methylobacterium sp. CG08_land_8_20_14_0_20_71_15]GBU16867.1 hypothetical protein AwMethylo_10820 [Methylobacterium sp.]GJE07986.1 hypothetical protein AOPFMNJM_3318 [Methylobacterium jeotgali]